MTKNKTGRLRATQLALQDWKKQMRDCIKTANIKINPTLVKYKISMVRKYGLVYFGSRLSNCFCKLLLKDGQYLYLFN